MAFEIEQRVYVRRQTFGECCLLGTNIPLEEWAPGKVEGVKFAGGETVYYVQLANEVLWEGVAENMVDFFEMEDRG
jgi:hypothetical protein